MTLESCGVFLGFFVLVYFFKAGGWPTLSLLTYALTSPTGVT